MSSYKERIAGMTSAEAGDFERSDRYIYTDGFKEAKYRARHIASEADAEIAALRAERDALKKERHELCGELHIVQQREWLHEADAARYRAFFDAGLPITFMGVEYRSKEALDAAIDAVRKEGT